MTTQCLHSANKKNSIYTLSTLQKSILNYLKNNPDILGDNAQVSKPVTAIEMAEILKSTIGSIKGTIYRLRKINAIEIFDFKRGRDAWTQYRITDDMWLKLIDAEKAIQEKNCEPTICNHRKNERMNKDINIYNPLTNKTINLTERQEREKAFSELWEIKPKRTGANSFEKAFQQYCDNLDAGEKHEDMVLGLKRYAAFCENSVDDKDQRIRGTQFVRMLSTFLADKSYKDDWSYSRSETQSEMQKRIMAELDAEMAREKEIEKQKEIDNEDRYFL